MTAQDSQPEQPVTSELDILDLRDLLTSDDDALGEYLALSLETDGENTTITVTTAGEQPHSYCAVLHGVVANDLGALLSQGDGVLPTPFPDNG